MKNKGRKGIALLLFGILLCVGGGEINQTILYHVSDFPFSLFGIIIGAVGLAITFREGADEKDK